MNIKISIVTICFNEAETIEKTIKSVLEQTYNNIEYIIIDGKSTDNTEDIILNYANKIDLYISEPDEGIFDAQNKGIKFATGEYVLILNAGDRLANKNVIEKTVNQISGEDILYGDVIFEMTDNSYYRKNSPKEITYINMFAESIPHPSTLYKRIIFDITGYFDKKYKLSADYDHFLKSVFEYKLTYKYVNFPISVFNLEGVSSSSDNKKLFDDERNNIQQKYFPENILKFLNLFKPFIILFRKKFYYLYFYLKSKFDKRFLECDWIIPV